MSQPSTVPGRTPHSPPRVVVMVASMGGMRALEEVLSAIPPWFPSPIVIAHHLPSAGPSHLAQLLGARAKLPVRWAKHLESLKAGHVYVGPAGSHITLTRYGRCSLSGGPKVNFVRPAGDLLFGSAAERVGRRTIGVVLSGRLSDGAAGAAAIRAAGGLVIAQDPATCAATGMPNATITSGSAHFVLPPRVIGAALVSLATVPGATELFGAGRARAVLAA